MIRVVTVNLPKDKEVNPSATDTAFIFENYVEMEDAIKAMYPDWTSLVITVTAK